MEAIKPQLISKRPMILFVEEDSDLTAINKKHLQAQGYRVLNANSAEEALKLFLSNWKDIDLIILDAQLPDDNTGGLTFVRFIRQKLTLKQIQQLGLTTEPDFDFTGEILIVSNDVTISLAEKFQKYALFPFYEVINFDDPVKSQEISRP